MSGRVTPGLCLGLVVSLAGCVSSGSRPLPDGVSTQSSLGGLTRDPERLPNMPLPRETIDLNHGLDPTAVAILAVLNSPDLVAKRAAAKVAAAQVFAAGLFPDPQVVLSLDVPTPGQSIGPGQFAQSAYGVVPSIDLATLITHSTALKAARASRRQVDLDLLWAEWSVAQQARVLAETIMANEAKAKALTAFADIAAARSDQSTRALKARDITSQVADADLALKIDGQSQAGSAAAAAAKARLDLNVLLGLDPTVQLPLAAAIAADWNMARIAEARAALSRRRPDLMALQAGYQAQEAGLRKAVLAQFPLLNIGLNHAKDNTGIVSNGPTATLTLPIFRSARGPIAVQAASRDQLRAEYQSRLDQTDAEVAADVAQRTNAETQALLLAEELPELARIDGAAQQAWRRGDLDGLGYVTLAQAYLTKEGDLQDRRLAARLAEISLEGALFLPPTSFAAPLGRQDSVEGHP